VGDELVSGARSSTAPVGDGLNRVVFSYSYWLFSYELPQTPGQVGRRLARAAFAKSPPR